MQSASRRLLASGTPLQAVVLNTTPFQTGWTGYQGARHVTLKTLKMRVTAVSNIKKITGAMKMVAAAKMNKIKVLNDNAGAYTDSASNTLKKFEKLAEETKGKHLIVPLTGDKGLCGSVNTQINKVAMATLRACPDDEEMQLLIVGQKGQDALKRLFASNFAVSIRDVGKQQITYAQAASVANEILAVPHDKVTIIYNKFFNQMRYDATKFSTPSIEVIKENPEVLDEYEFDTENDTMQLSIEDLYEFQLASVIHGFLLEGRTSEEASRMAAMENATKNAGELIDKLQLQYNKGRQAVITSELIEIISGAEAV